MKRCTSNDLSVLLWTLLALALAPMACSSGPSTDSETHWQTMRSCSSDTQCGEGLSCLCGICTRTCDDDMVCAGVDADAQCVAVNADDESCEEQPAAGASICRVPCDDAVACSIYGSRMTCADGFCGLAAEWSLDEADAGDVSPSPGDDDVAPEVDILWMIDNSGSMCQEQQVLRERFEAFVDELVRQGVNFHVAVTTTHMAEASLLEPVAQPGHLQSTPQPVPGFDASCYHRITEQGEIERSDWTLVREAIRTALACTEDPDAPEHQALLEVTDQELRCAFYPHEASSCPDGMELRREDLFPDPSAYRPLPKVLRAMDYRRPDGKPDIARLREDFACMSLVGTRGYGFEKGLAAVARAVDPELTGGPGAEADAAPNAGFLRPEARTAVIFVTDENDCSHNGRLDEQTSCGVAECSFRNRPGATDSPLIPVADLKEAFMTNLSASKGRTVSDDEVVMASIHGAYQIFDEERPAECPAGFNIPYSCFSPLGIAYSGDRYEAYIRQFPNFYPEPAPAAPEAPLPGLVCDDFSGALTEIAGKIARP